MKCQYCGLPNCNAWLNNMPCCKRCYGEHKVAIKNRAVMLRKWHARRKMARFMGKT